MNTNDVKAALSLAGGLAICWLGGWDVALKVLLFFMVVDYITGVANAWYQKRLDSFVGLRGIVTKIGLLVAVAVAAQIDVMTGQPGAVRSIAIMFLAANEGLSVAENLTGIGVPLPSAMTNALASWKAQDEQQKEGEKV